MSFGENVFGLLWYKDSAGQVVCDFRFLHQQRAPWWKNVSEVTGFHKILQMGNHLS